MSLPAFSLMRIGLKASGKPGEACFWKKQSPSAPSRTAHQAERPIGDMRQDAVGDGEVVFGQLPLGDAVARKDHPVGMGDAHALDLDRLVVPWSMSTVMTDEGFGTATSVSPGRPPALPAAGRLRRNLGDDLLRRLVRAQSLVAAVADIAVVGPAAEGDLGDEVRLDEMRRAAGRRAGTSSAGGVFTARFSSSGQSCVSSRSPKPLPTWPR